MEVVQCKKNLLEDNCSVSLCEYSFDNQSLGQFLAKQLTHDVIVIGVLKHLLHPHDAWVLDLLHYLQLLLQ